MADPTNTPIPSTPVNRITKLQRRKMAEAVKFNKWLKREGSTLVYDPLMGTKFYESHLPPKVKFGDFKIRPDLKDKMKKWAWEERMTSAAYIRKILAKWEKYMDKQERKGAR